MQPVRPPPKPETAPQHQFKTVPAGDLPSPGAPQAFKMPEVKAAVLKVSGFGEAAATAAATSLIPLGISFAADAHREAQAREQYRQRLLAELQAPKPVKAASFFVPMAKKVKDQAGSYVEGLLQDTADQLNTATKVPLQLPPPFSTTPPVRMPL